MDWKEFEIAEVLRKVGKKEMKTYRVTARLEGAIFKKWLSSPYRLDEFESLKEARAFVEKMKMNQGVVKVTTIEKFSDGDVNEDCESYY